MTFRWPKSRYVRLLEEDRLLHLAEIESLKIKCERQTRSLLLMSNSPSAHEYMRRTEQRPQAPAAQMSEPQSWDDYEERYNEHLRHLESKNPIVVPGCPFCEPKEVMA